MKIKLLATAVAISAMETSAMAQGTTTAITTKSGELPSPKTGDGQVVFFRPGSMMGMALGCTIHNGDAEVARLGSGKYSVLDAKPGKYVFSTSGTRKDALNLEVEAGETYFVKCSIGVGVMAGAANLSPSDQAAFAHKAKGLTLWKSKSE